MSLDVPTPSLSASLSTPTLSFSSSSPSSSSPPASSSPSLPSSSPSPPSSSPPPSSSSSTPSTSSSLVPSSSTSSFVPSTSPSVTSTSLLPSTSTPLAPPSSYSTSTPFVTASAVGALPLASSSVLDHTPFAATPTPTPSQSSSPSGFFSNTGAVAGTFTVVGLVAIASLIAVLLLIAKRRHSRSYEDDDDFLDKNPDLSLDPPTNQVVSFDDGFSSDQGHYTAPPMAIANPPAVYYPEHAYALHPQAFPVEGYTQQPSHPYPVAYPQHSVTQRIHSPDNYDIAYPPATSHVATDMPNPHVLPHAEPDSAPLPHTQTGPPLVLHPSVRSMSAARANSRMSVDSFYAGIATDTVPSHGQAL